LLGTAIAAGPALALRMKERCTSAMDVAPASFAKRRRTLDASTSAMPVSVACRMPKRSIWNMTGPMKTQ